jgi:anti-sigma factor RsiW
MNLENHEQAKKLLAAAQVEGISASEHHWLEAHLAACSECSSEAQALGAAIELLRELSVTVRPEITLRTRLAVQRRAEQRRLRQESWVPLWIAVAVSSVWIVFTAPYVWSVFAWFGSVLHLPEPIWQLTFLTWWFLPATIVAAVVCWRHAAGRKPAPVWTTEMNWGHS